MCFPTHPSRKDIPLLCLMNFVYSGIFGWLSVRVVWWWNPLFSAISEWQLAPPLPSLPETTAKYFLLAKYEEVYLSIHLHWNLAHYFHGQPSSCTKVCSLLGLWLFIFIKHPLQGNCWEKNDRETLSWLCPVIPAVPEPVCLILGMWLGLRDSSSPAVPQPLLQALAQIQHHLPVLAFILCSHWAQQVRFLTHPFTRSLVSLGFSLGQYGLSLLPEFTHPCACSLLLMPCSGQTQPLVQIRMLQGSACPTHSFPNSPFWLCGFREQSHQGENPKGGCAEPHASILLKCHNVCNTWSDLCWCGTSQFNSVAPVQNLFPDFVATLIVEGQNASLLFYLGPAFMDDYSYPAGAWRSISLKISMCPQVIGVMCSKGKCLIRGRFLQESRKQPFPAVNQLFLKMENVFSHHLLTRGGHPDRGCHCSGWQRWLTWNLEPRLPLQNCCSALHLLSCLTQAI